MEKQLKDKNIFIVEDNINNRVIYQMIMMKHGAKVEFDRWGRDTISKLLRMRDIDVIVLDLMLPNGQSGYEIYDIIRQKEEFKHIPIVAVSAAEPTVAIRKTREQGFAGFIAKPIDDELFPDQLSQIIAGKSIWYAGAY